ncbi:hypothetical protein EUX98_g8893 [Antrodiella citrinella]|uniref:hAT-like transposase RNase-H fold domain-containing protein n=1 Tax=Antrodiella citrinella TaxID=2447956 RepID=A0A4S4M1T6_9APHY|nr:hypothetical protein EUX98_g8893 [Antrodiella citrinella]
MKIFDLRAPSYMPGVNNFISPQSAAALTIPASRTEILTLDWNKAEVVRWLSESFRPYETIKDRGFLCLMKTGCPELWVPSLKTAGRDMINAHIESRNRVARLLISYAGRISFSSDTWTSPNHRSYMAILAHLEHEGHPLVLPLDLAEVPFSHTGAALSEVMQRTVLDFGIATKVLTFTGDNATNNDTLCTEWSKRNPEFLGDESRIRCILHTESLAAHIIIKQFDVLPGSSAIDMDDTEKVLRELAEDEDESDNNSEDELADDAEGSFDERAMMSVGERRQHEADVRPMKMVLVKVFYDATQYFSSAAPNLAQVIPAMDLIDEHLNDNIFKPDLHPAIRIVLTMAKWLLNRYYSHTDVTPAYHIAMVLHPCHKLGYFADWNWEPKWIRNARLSVYNEFTTHYLKYVT